MAPHKKNLKGTGGAPEKMGSREAVRVQVRSKELKLRKNSQLRRKPLPFVKG